MTEAEYIDMLGCDEEPILKSSSKVRVTKKPAGVTVIKKPAGCGATSELSHAHNFKMLDGATSELSHAHNFKMLDVCSKQISFENGLIGQARDRRRNFVRSRIWHKLKTVIKNEKVPQDALGHFTKYCMTKITNIKPGR